MSKKDLKINRMASMIFEIKEHIKDMKTGDGFKTKYRFEIQKVCCNHFWVYTKRYSVCVSKSEMISMLRAHHYCEVLGLMEWRALP